MIILGKLVKKFQQYAPPEIKSTGVMNMGSSDPYADRDNIVKIVIASIAMGASAVVGYALYASGFNPYGIRFSGLPEIKLSGSGLDNLILIGVGIGIVAMIGSGIYQRVRRSF